MKKSLYLSSLLFVSSILFSVAAHATVPTVTTDPSSATACSGSIVKFFIAAVDTPGPLTKTYSWQVSTDGGTVWSTIHDTTFYATTNTDTLRVTARMMLDGFMYRGIVTNATGADTSADASLMVDTAYAGALSGPSRVCRSGAITLVSSVAGGTWSSSTPAIATVGSSTGVVTAMPTAFGYDTIKYSVTNTCGTSTSWTLVHVDSTVTAAPIFGPTLTCVGNHITLTNANTVGTGVWSSGNPAVATVSGSGVVTGVSHGTAVISYNFSTACNSVTSTFTVSVDTVLSPGIISGDTTLCAGSWTGLSSSVGGGIWLSSSSATAVVMGGTVTGVSEGTATISYIVTNGCGSSIATHTMHVTRSASMITGLDSVGIGLTRTLADSAAGGFWTIADTTIAVVDSFSGVVTGRTAGTTTVTYTVTNACGTSMATLLMHVGAAPDAGAITGADSVCIGSSITLSNAAAPGGSWHIDDSISMSRATITGGGVVSGVVYGVANVSYTFTNGFGSTTIAKTVFVNRPPVVTVTGPTETLRKGANYLISGTPYGGTWSSSNTGIALIIATIDSVGLHLVSQASVIMVGYGTSVLTYTVHNTCGTTSATDTLTAVRNTAGIAGINGSNEGINVYPNPTNGDFTFNLATAKNEEVTLLVTNVTGEVVKELKVNTNTTQHMFFDVPAGLYMLTATTESGTYTAKVSVAK